MEVLINKEEFKGKVVLVTGASRGIGKAIAIELAKCGASVAINYNSNTRLAKNTLKSVRSYGVNAEIIKANVSEEKEVKYLIRETEKKLGPINILINNAGKTKFVDFQNFKGLNKKDFLDIYEANLVSVFQMVRACEKSLLKTKKPKIINVSSIAALGMGSSIAYACSKGALNSLSLSLARTLAPKITVNSICPGYVETGWHGSSKEVYKKSKINEKLVPLKKSAKPEDIASSIMWFVNSKNLITGETIYVDGGYHLKA